MTFFSPTRSWRPRSFGARAALWLQDWLPRRLALAIAGAGSIGELCTQGLKARRSSCGTTLRVPRT